MSEKKGTAFTSFLYFFVIAIVIFFMMAQICSFLKNSNKAKNITNEKEEEPYNGKYYLKFNDNFNKSLASQDDLGLSILIAIDCSGSMNDLPKRRDDNYKNKYIIASESLTEIVSFFYDYYEKNVKNQETKLKLGIMKFNNKPEILFDLKEINKETLDEIISITSNADNFSPNGKTAIGDTIKNATEILSQSGTIFKSLIIITDGENTAGEEPEVVLEAVVENRNNKNIKDYPVLTNNILVSFIGFDIDSEVFKNLNNLGSRVTSASDKIELNNSLKNLFLADITKLESK